METGSEIATGANTTTLISDTATDIDADGLHLTNCFPPKEMWVYEYCNYEANLVFDGFYGEWRALKDARIYLNSDFEVATGTELELNMQSIILQLGPNMQSIICNFQ